VGGSQPQQHIQKVGNPQPLQNSYIWSKRGSPHSTQEGKQITGNVSLNQIQE